MQEAMKLNEEIKQKDEKIRNLIKGLIRYDKG